MATPTIKDLLTSPPTWPTSRTHLISSCPPTPFPHVRFTWHMFTRRTNHAATQDAVAVPGAAQRVRDECQTRRTDMFLDSLPRCRRSGALADALRGSKRRHDRVCQSAPHRVVEQGQVVRGGVRRSFARGMRNRFLACRVSWRRRSFFAIRAALHFAMLHVHTPTVPVDARNRSLAASLLLASERGRTWPADCEGKGVKGLSACIRRSASMACSRAAP